MSRQTDTKPKTPGAAPGDDADVMVTLALDDGSSVECEILTIFDVGGSD